METPAWLDRSAWPFTARALTVDGARVHYIEEGQGPTVLLVHGTPTWAFEWRHVIAALRTRARVVAFDHLGFGLSERPAGAGYRPEDHAARFHRVVEALCPSGPLTLVLHDFGGPIALDWALEHPERLAHLVVTNTWMWRLDDDPDLRWKARLAGGALMRWMYRRLNASQKLIMPSAYAVKSRLTPAIHRQYLEVFPDADSRERVLFALAKALAGSSAYYDALWQRRHRLAGVDVRVVWGTKDSAFPPRMIDRWLEACPQAQVTRLDDAGHWPHEESPDAYIRALP